MTPYELIDAFHTVIVAGREDFEFWVSLSFALIAASHFGRDRMTARLAWLATGLYALVTAMMFVRLLGAYAAESSIATAAAGRLEAGDPGVEFIAAYAPNPYIYAFLALSFAIGSIATVSFVFAELRKRDPSSA